MAFILYIYVFLLVYYNQLADVCSSRMHMFVVVFLRPSQSVPGVMSSLCTRNNHAYVRRSCWINVIGRMFVRCFARVARDELDRGVRGCSRRVAVRNRRWASNIGLRHRNSRCFAVCSLSLRLVGCQKQTILKRSHCRRLKTNLRKSVL